MRCGGGGMMHCRCIHALMCKMLEDLVHQATRVSCAMEISAGIFIEYMLFSILGRNLGFFCLARY
jgi:hypothetical protein